VQNFFESRRALRQRLLVELVEPHAAALLVGVTLEAVPGQKGPNRFLECLPICCRGWGLTTAVWWRAQDEHRTETGDCRCDPHPVVAGPDERPRLGLSCRHANLQIGSPE